MKSPIKLLAVLVSAFCLSIAAFAAESSPAGTWKWSVQGRQGGQSFDQTLTLDVKEGKLTGVMLGRQGGQYSVPDTPISEASLQDGMLKFTVTREFNGRSFTTKYQGKLDGDTIKGTYERPGFNGGEPVTNEWLAKRQK